MPTEELESEKRSPAAPASKPVRRRAGLRKIGAAFAWLAGVGAILGGLTGYWSTYRTVTTELLAPAPDFRSPCCRSPISVAIRGKTTSPTGSLIV
jgi:hypothetical protein